MSVNQKNIGQVISILKKQYKSLPTPAVTLVAHKWKSPFLVLISCILSLRTKDETTLPASLRLFALADTPKGLMKLKSKQIEKVIYPVGFYKTKAQTIRDISRNLNDNYFHMFSFFLRAYQLNKLFHSNINFW